MSVIVNTQLIESLAQAILSLEPEEQKLLSQAVQRLRSPVTQSVDVFFSDLEGLAPDPKQPTLQEISEEVKAVRHELWAQK